MPRGRVSKNGYRANGPTVTFRLTDAENASLEADAKSVGVSKHHLAKMRAVANRTETLELLERGLADVAEGRVTEVPREIYVERDEPEISTQSPAIDTVDSNGNRIW